MTYLLDTHTLLWYVFDKKEIPQKSRAIIKDPKNLIFVSVVSIWEVAIKINAQKVNFKVNLHTLLSDIKNSPITILSIEEKYLHTYTTLPRLHKDPYDRMLISTCLTDDLTIITKDKDIQQYDIKWVW